MSTTDVSAVPEYLRKYMADGGGTRDADSMASASNSIPRISLKGKKFQFINGDDESKKSEKIHVVILAVDPEGGRMIKTFYASGYNPTDTAPPDCSSSDGIGPDSWVQKPVSTNCNGCPKNIFGSATSPSGKKTKACRDAKRLWVVKADDVGGTVYGLNVPVTSLKNMSEYGRDIKSAGAPLSAIITEIYMDEESEFPMIHFKRLGFLNEEFGSLAIERNTSRDWMASVNTANRLAAPASSGAPALPPARAANMQDVIVAEISEANAAASGKSVDDIANQWG